MSNSLIDLTISELGHCSKFILTLEPRTSISPRVPRYAPRPNHPPAGEKEDWLHVDSLQYRRNLFTLGRLAYVLCYGQKQKHALTRPAD